MTLRSGRADVPHRGFIELGGQGVVRRALRGGNEELADHLPGAVAEAGRLLSKFWGASGEQGCAGSFSGQRPFDTLRVSCPAWFGSGVAG